MSNTIVRSADILLPRDGIELQKWAVVAVDQHTSEPEYWESAERIVGDAPSTLRLVLPEIYLNANVRSIKDMQRCMQDYLEKGILEKKVRDGFVLIERETSCGARLGIMACIDLEAYDYAPGFKGAVRATEGTVLERVPPRVKLRSGAAIELPHILMLLDDPSEHIIEPLYEGRDVLPLLYDFDLMLGGGRIRAWRVEGDAARTVGAAFDAHRRSCGELFLAVGDGNHSLAAARACWMKLRDSLPHSERETHPARFALVEIENLFSPAIRFEPIHRLITEVDSAVLLEEIREELEACALRAGDAYCLGFICGERLSEMRFGEHPLGALQEILDRRLASHPQAQMDYIHGEDTLERLAKQPNALGIRLCGFEKAALFPYVIEHGVLPRKTFSMGEADEKRFYCEAHSIVR